MEKNEFYTTELQDRAPNMDPAIAIRCAKVAYLLSDLQHFSTDQDEYAKKKVSAEVMRELMKLEGQLLKERENNKKKRFNSLIELCVWIGISLCLWNICLLLFFDFANHY